jgi:hypothetical protein
VHRCAQLHSPFPDDGVKDVEGSALQILVPLTILDINRDGPIKKARGPASTGGINIALHRSSPRKLRIIQAVFL